MSKRDSCGSIPSLFLASKHQWQFPQMWAGLMVITTAITKRETSRAFPYLFSSLSDLSYCSLLLITHAISDTGAVVEFRLESIPFGIFFFLATWDFRFLGNREIEIQSNPLPLSLLTFPLIIKSCNIILIFVIFMNLFLILHFLCNYKSKDKNKAASHDDLVVLGYETKYFGLD